MNVGTDGARKANEGRKLVDLGRIGLVSALVLFSAVAIAQEPFDLVVMNGRVIDPETMYDGVANVGIKDGRIAVITTNSITGRAVGAVKTGVLACCTPA